MNFVSILKMAIDDVGKRLVPDRPKGLALAQCSPLLTDSIL